jgi:hypothetical protein
MNNSPVPYAQYEQVVNECKSFKQQIEILQKQLAAFAEIVKAKDVLIESLISGAKK